MARPALSAPSAYGTHLASLRQAAGLTQQQLADAVGVKQSNIAFWERAAKPPRGEVLPALAAALGVSISVLLQQADSHTTSRHRGPASRVERLIEEVSRLPRRRQQQIADMIEVMLSQSKAS